MVEGVAREVPEETFCDAVLFAYQEVQCSLYNIIISECSVLWGECEYTMCMCSRLTFEH